MAGAELADADSDAAATRVLEQELSPVGRERRVKARPEALRKVHAVCPVGVDDEHRAAVAFGVGCADQETPPVWRPRLFEFLPAAMPQAMDVAAVGTHQARLPRDAAW